MIWAIIQVSLRQGISLVVFFLLSRLLVPADFGLLGMAFTWIAFGQAISELGFGAALIQKKGVESHHLSTTFFVNILVGIIMTLAGILLSWPCAIFYRLPAVRTVMAVLSLNFVITAFSVTQSVLLQKELRFRDLAIRDAISAVAGGAIGVIAALQGYGVWSLVIQTLCTGIVGSFLIWKLTNWRPKWSEFSWEILRELWSYSFKIYLFSIFKYFAQNTDRLLIGYFLGPIALGLYTFSYKIVAYPISMFIGSIGLYLFPKYSEIQDNPILVRDSYSSLTRTLHAIVAPIAIAGIFLSPAVVPAVFGIKWLGAVPVIQIMSVLILTFPAISLAGQIMKALGRPELLFYWSVLITILTVVGIALGARYGIIGVAIAYAVAYLVAWPINIIFLRKITPLHISNIVTMVRPLIIPTITGISALWLMSVMNLRVDNWIVVGFTVTFGGYLLSLIVFDSSFVYDTFIKIKNQLKLLEGVD